MAATGGATFAVADPATEETIVQVADGTCTDWMKALELADASKASFAALAPRERAELLRDIFAAVTARKEDFARMMTLEMGKPYKEA